MKHLEETPWFVCDEGDTNFCAYIDTDSNYFNAEPLLKYLYPDFESFDDGKKDEILEEIALKYQNIITEHYNVLAKECFNVPDFIGEEPHKHHLEMKTECVIRSAYFRATRRYAQWITKKEGITKEELDIKGLEFMKANFPPIFGDKY
jgi:DNA polymerase elongation subunit (family B)